MQTSRVEIEESIVRQVIGRPGLALQAALDAGVRPALFTDSGYRKLFETIVRLHEDGVPPDSEAMQRELERSGEWGRLRDEHQHTVIGAGNTAERAETIVDFLSVRLAELKRIEHHELIESTLDKLRAAMNGLGNKRLAREILDDLQLLNEGTATDPLIQALRGEPTYALPLAQFLEARDEQAKPLLGAGEDMILPAGGLGIVSGKPGVGKTTFAVDAAFHLASGVDWLGESVPRPLNILLIENEGPREPFRRKLEQKRQSWPHEIEGGLFVYAERWGAATFADSGQRVRLRRFLEGEEIDLVIADPLGSLGVEGVGSPAETREFVSLLKELGLFEQVSFWLLHHFRHGRKEPVTSEIDELSGSWGGHVDALLMLKEEAGERIRLSFPKLRWGQPRKPLIVKRLVESAGFEVVAEAEAGVDEEAGKARILAFLEEHPPSPEGPLGVSTRKVEEGAGGRRENVRRWLQELEGDGLVDGSPGGPGRGGRGTYWKLSSHAGLSSPGLFGANPGEPSLRPAGRGSSPRIPPLPVREGIGGEPLPGDAEEGRDIPSSDDLSRARAHARGGS